MPLYINCTEVTHIYTNGSYQLVYQNCTPVFVRTKQVFNYVWRLQQMVMNTWKCLILKLPYFQIEGLSHIHPYFRCDQWAEEVGKDGEEDRVEVQTDVGVWELKDQGRCRVLLPQAMQRQPSIWRSSELSVEESPAGLHTSDSTIQSLWIFKSLYILYMNIFKSAAFHSSLCRSVSFIISILNSFSYYRWKTTIN